MKHKISVIGAGNMGTALAQLIASNGHPVALWNYEPGVLKKIAKNHRSPFLSGIKLSSRIKPVEDIGEAVQSADVVILAVSSPYVRQTAAQVASHLNKHAVVVCIAKGIETKTGLTMAGVVAEEIPAVNRRRVTELSGPSLADEFVRGVPTAVVLASKDRTATEKLRSIFESKTFKVATSTDVRGVALCGALKNAYSIALGLCDGMGYGMNAKAFMATVAMQEMEDLVYAAGGKRASADGLAGHGDLMVTGFGNSRNREFGMKLAKCVQCSKLIKETDKTTEGIEAALAAYKLAKKLKLKLSLLEAIYGIVFKGKKPTKTIENFFQHAKFE